MEGILEKLHAKLFAASGRHFGLKQAQLRNGVLVKSQDLHSCLALLAANERKHSWSVDLLTSPSGELLGLQYEVSE